MKEAFKKIMEEPPKGATEAAREGIQAVAPGLSLSKILNDIGSEMKQQAAHGAHELAAVLFNGSGFVSEPCFALPKSFTTPIWKTANFIASKDSALIEF